MTGAPADRAAHSLDEIRLRVPATTEHLAVARLFGAGAARHFGGTADDVEDLRLAVSEACTMAMQAARSPGVLEVAVWPTQGGVTACVRTEPPGNDGRQGDGATAGAIVHDLFNGWAADLLRAMVVSLRVEPDPDGQVTLTFVFDLDANGDGAHGDTAASTHDVTGG